MLWPFNTGKRRAEIRERDLMRELKVLESQRALLDAATETADAANHVTNRLKSRLEDSMAQFENTARILNDALIICDLTGEVQAFNPAAERLFGIPADEVRQTFVGDLFTSNTHKLESGESIWSLLNEMEAAEHDHDLSGIREDGGTFPVDVNHTRLDRSDGTSIVLLILRDLTPCEETKESLRSYRSVFNSAFDCILVVSGDRILAANPAASVMFGYTVEQLLMKTLDGLIMNGREHVSEGVDVKGEGVHQDGHLMEVFFTANPIMWNGQPASLVTIKNLIPLAPEKVDAQNMICCFGADFRITFVNAAFASFYGIKREKLIGMDIRDLLPSDDQKPFIIHINSLTENEPTRRMQLQSRRPDGAVCLQLWTDHASYDEEGVEYQRIGRDITETIKTRGTAG